MWGGIFVLGLGEVGNADSVNASRPCNATPTKFTGSCVTRNAIGTVSGKLRTMLHTLNHASKLNSG